MDIELCTNSKRIPLMAVGYDGLRKGNYGFVGMGDFLNKTRFWNKYKALIQFKTFSQHTIISNFHRNKDNEQLPFLNTFAPVSLQYNIPFSKNIGLASVLQLPFRTGSKHPKKWVASHTGLGTKGGNITKKLFGRVLNRPRSPEGRNPLGYFWFFS